MNKSLTTINSEVLTIIELSNEETRSRFRRFNYYGYNVKTNCLIHPMTTGEIRRIKSTITDYEYTELGGFIPLLINNQDSKYEVEGISTEDYIGLSWTTTDLLLRRLLHEWDIMLISSNLSSMSYKHYIEIDKKPQLPTWSLQL